MQPKRLKLRQEEKLSSCITSTIGLSAKSMYDEPGVTLLVISILAWFSFWSKLPSAGVRPVRAAWQKI
jgi:hypothetical protein